MSSARYWQRWLARLQVCPTGQSELELQPQNPLPGEQACPFGLDKQSTQAKPLVPHAAVCVPAAQVPALQHPPLHTVWLAPPQAEPHVCLEVSHACWSGQSLATLQPPHTPAKHAAPGQTLPQVPQLFASVMSETQAVPQKVKPGLQESEKFAQAFALVNPPALAGINWP